MKILRKANDFKKFSEKNFIDVLVINNLIKQGWKYCSKQDYKDFFKTEKKKKTEEKSEKKAKKSNKKKE